MLYKLESELMQACEGITAHSDIVKAIKKAGYLPDDDTKEYGYINIRVHAFGGYVRIYKPVAGRNKGKLLFQVWNPVKVSYSGAPMFSTNPSYF